MSETGHPLASVAIPEPALGFGSCSVSRGGCAKLDELDQLNPLWGLVSSHSYVTLTYSVGLSVMPLAESGLMVDGMVLDTFTTNQSADEPVELDADGLDVMFICLSPPVVGMTPWFTGTIICWPGTILSSGGVVTVWVGVLMLADWATKLGMTEVTLGVFGTE